MRRSLGPKTYTPRLACVKPAASVHPEPGSNSSSYILNILINVNLRLCFFLHFKRVITLSYVLSIQYVYERVFLVFHFQSLASLAGCKHTNVFSFLANVFLFFLDRYF